MLEMYGQLNAFKAALHALLDSVILTPFELAAHSEVSLMLGAYTVQFCLYYSEFLPVSGFPIPEEVGKRYGPVAARLGVVVSHELPFTAMKEQAKKSFITGIIAVKSTTTPAECVPVVLEEKDCSSASVSALVQGVVDVTDAKENKLAKSYPLWRMFNFKIKYETSKGQPIQIKFSVRVGDEVVEFDTRDYVVVRTNDTQTLNFAEKTFIVKNKKNNKIFC